VLLKAAINGARARDEHPALPLLPDELATSAAAALQAGAGAVHFHVRAADGRESLAPADLETALGAIRRSCGASPIGVSTGAWIVPEPAERLAAVRGWRARPDFASLNFEEAGAVELARLLLERGIGVEAGLASPGAARALVRSGLGNACLRLRLEPPEPEPIAALRTVTEIETVLVAADLTGPRLLHGAGPTAWPLPDGRMARHNGELVTTAVADAARAVELAYFTFPAWEGRGYATAMADALRALAASTGQVSIVRAHTLPLPNASGHILQTPGFTRVGEVLDPEDGLVWRWDWPVPAHPA
jgi:beta-keto acid cleavage enzyme